jgi:predicted metal-binding membrane protein
VAALGLFLLAWQLMVAAMMLPSSLPMLRLFGVASAGQDRPGAVLAAFLGGYGLVWTVFGALAFTGDLALHRLVHRLPWLQARPWLLAGGCSPWPVCSSSRA